MGCWQVAFILKMLFGIITQFERSHELQKCLRSSKMADWRHLVTHYSLSVICRRSLLGEQYHVATIHRPSSI